MRMMDEQLLGKQWYEDSISQNKKMGLVISIGKEVKMYYNCRKNSYTYRYEDEMGRDEEGESAYHAESMEHSL